MANLQRTLEDTPEVQALKQLRPTRGPFVRDAAEAQKGYEIWARAYSQYIAQRSRNPVLLAGLNDRRANVDFDFLKMYWSDKNFQPVAKAFNALFRAKGWLAERKAE